MELFTARQQCWIFACFPVLGDLNGASIERHLFATDGIHHSIDGWGSSQVGYRIEESYGNASTDRRSGAETLLSLIDAPA